MKRRRTKIENGYDSVLDTMTNVVGILVLVVIVTQVSVTDAVDRARKSPKLPGGEAVTKELLEEARQNYAALERNLAVCQARWKDIEETSRDREIELFTLEEAMRTLETEVQAPMKAVGPLDSIRSGLETLDRAADSLRALVARAGDQVERLSTVSEGPDTSEERVLTLPDPTPKRSEDRVRVNFYCRKGEVFPFPLDRLRTLHDKALADVIASRNWDDWNELLQACERDLASLDIGSEDFELHVTSRMVWSFVSIAGVERKLPGNLLVSYLLEDGAHGDRVEEIREQRGQFEAEVEKARNEEVWFYFYVFDDSFDIYLAARERAASVGIPVGWVAYGADEEVRLYCFNAGGEGWEAVPD